MKNDEKRDQAFENNHEVSMAVGLRKGEIR